MTQRTDQHAQVVQFWCEQYFERVGAKYPFQGGKDGKTIKWLREMYSDDDIRSFMAGFFEIEDEFIQTSGYGLGVFRGCLPKVIQFVKCGQKRVVPNNLRGVEQWMSRKAQGE